VRGPLQAAADGAYFGLPWRRRNGAEGRSITQPPVRAYDGRRALLDDILGEDFALVGYACDPRASLEAKTLAQLTALGARFVAIYPFGERPQGDVAKWSSAAGALVKVDDLTGEGIVWFRGAGARNGYVVLIRPDKFVHALAPASGAADIVTHAQRAMNAEEALRVPASDTRPFVPA